MEILQKFKELLLDILFPITCLSCSADDFWLCPECLKKIAVLPSQVCPYCEKIITEGGRICPKCQNNFLGKNIKAPLDALVCATRYKENNISKLVHLYKYNFIENLSVPLGKIMVKSILKNNLPIADAIIPVPLHSRRLRWREFNQSEKLANFISENLTPSFPLSVYSDFLIRKRYTTAQMKIKNYSLRKENIKNAFVANKNQDLSVIKNKRILLVDDIATTGATLFECAKILKKNGAKEVFGVVIARQEMR